MRRSNKEPIIHVPATIDIYYSLCNYPGWLGLLLSEHKHKEYHKFLQGLFEKCLYKGESKRITIKRISSESGFKTQQVTKWISEMYEDIFTLNTEKPELFKQEGIKHDLFFKCYDMTTSFSLWLNTTPKIYERFSCFFMEAKLGCRSFWVSDIHHEYDTDGHTIAVSLKAGFPNYYREFLLSKALYKEEIGFMDAYLKYDFEIDSKLKSLYKD